VKTTVIIQTNRAQGHIACRTCGCDESCLLSSEVLELRQRLERVLKAQWNVSIPKCTGWEARRPGATEVPGED